MIPPKALIVDIRKDELFESFGQLPPLGPLPATALTELRRLLCARKSPLGRNIIDNW